MTGPCCFNSTQDHEVFAKHNKFGIFLVPQNFLNWNGPPDQHHTLDTPSRELKKLSNVERENKEAAEKASAEEKMKKEAKEEAKKARRERAKTQQAAAAMAAMEEEAEVKAAAEIAMEHADPTKASKAESAVQIKPIRSALVLLKWLRGRSSSLGGCPQWSGHCLTYVEALRSLVHSGRMLGLLRDHACSIFRSY